MKCKSILNNVWICNHKREFTTMICKSRYIFITSLSFKREEIKEGRLIQNKGDRGGRKFVGFQSFFYMFVNIVVQLNCCNMDMFCPNQDCDWLDRTIFYTCYLLAG